MKKRGEGAERERGWRGRKGEEGGGVKGVNKGGGEGNTGTSHELNRTANSSTRERGEAGQEAGQEVGGNGRGRGDRSLLHYATHTYTHKKNGTQVAFPVKVACGER